jgi:hypothetical protein
VTRTATDSRRQIEVIDFPSRRQRQQIVLRTGRSRMPGLDGKLKRAIKYFGRLLQVLDLCMVDEKFQNFQTCSKSKAKLHIILEL